MYIPVHWNANYDRENNDYTSVPYAWHVPTLRYPYDPYDTYLMIVFHMLDMIYLSSVFLKYY